MRDRNGTDRAGLVIVFSANSGRPYEGDFRGEAETIAATVEAIDTTTRTLNVKGPKGYRVPITMPNCSVEEKT